MAENKLYPGYILKRGSENISKDVWELQKRLQDFGCGPEVVDGDFGTNTETAVRTFQ